MTSQTTRYNCSSFKDVEGYMATGNENEGLKIDQIIKTNICSASVGVRFCCAVKEPF